MIEYLTMILGSACFGWLITTGAEPAQKIKYVLGLCSCREDYGDRPVLDFFTRLFECTMCLTFWIALIVSGNILVAAISSISGKIIESELI